MLKIIKSFRVVFIVSAFFAGTFSLHVDSAVIDSLDNNYCLGKNSTTNRSGGGDTIVSSLGDVLTDLANARSCLAATNILSGSGLLSLAVNTNLLAVLLQNIALSAVQGEFVSLLYGMSRVVMAVQAAALNPNFLTSNQGIIASSLLNVSAAFNTIAQNSNFSVQADVDTAAATAITFVAVLDALAAAWSLTSSLNGTNTTARSALAAFSMLTSGVYVYTNGSASVAKIKTASSAIAAYVGQLMSLKSLVQYSVGSSSLYGIACGFDGNMWAVDNQNGGLNVCSISPTGSVANYSTGNSGRNSSITRGPDNNLWVTDWYPGVIGKVIASGSSKGAITQYSVSGAAGKLEGICSGPDGKIWFAERWRNYIGSVTTAGTVTQYAMSPGDSRPIFIAAGSDGNLWVTDNARGSVWKVNPSNGSGVEYGSSLTGIWSIVQGPDGNMWVAINGKNTIGKVAPSGTITEYSLPTGTAPKSLVVDGRGNIWVVGSSNKLVCFNVTTSSMTTVTRPDSYASNGIAIDASGNVWFTEGTTKVSKLILQ